MDEGWRKDCCVFLLAAALAVGILLLDRSHPLGLAGGAPYVAVVILGWWLRRRNGIFLLATLCSILIVAGYFLSPPGDTFWMIASNRIVTLAVIWLTALLLAMAKRTADELPRSELRAKAAEQRLMDAIESSSEGFVVYDSDDRLVLCNSKWMALYGYSEDRVGPGISYEDLVRLDVELGAVQIDDDDDYIRQRIAYRRRFEGSFDIQLRDGRWITIRERETSDGGIVGVQTDITERKHAEETVRVAMEESELSSRAKSEFLANMSHELRTPLNAIIGFAQVIENDAFGAVGAPKYRDYAADISASGQHLLDIINDILDLSKIESGRMEVHEENVNVEAVIHNCVSLMSERARAADVDILTKLPDRAGLELRVDERMLKQILINLLSNAVKFTPPGGQVTVNCEQSVGGGMVLRVKDTGIGIAEADLSSAFARFGQIDSQLARKYEGTGLGLPLSKLFAERLGGSLELMSAEDIGTTVTVRLPPERVLRGTGQRYHAAR